MTKQDDKVKSQEEVKVEENKEVTQLKQKNEELENSYKRALADYQNLQKRTNEERVNWLKISNRELLLRLLPVLDTLILANKHKQTDELKVCLSQFFEALKAEGVMRIEAVGKAFDPELMEVVDVTEGEEGKVLDEVRAGFMIHDKLLRPSQVRVGKAK